MAAGKKRTTMAKLNRESKLREKRDEKEARKARRRLESADSPADSIGPANSQGEFSVPSAAERAAAVSRA